MIDPEFDDGFTFEVDGLRVRPILHNDPVRKSQYLDKHVHQICFFRQRPTPAMIQAVAAYTVSVENKDFQDLSDSVSLHVLYSPGLSQLDCTDCKRYAVDPSTGVIQIGPDNRPKPIPGGISVNCETHVGCWKRHHSDPIGLSNPRWAKTWRHYWTYRNRTDHWLNDDFIFQRNKLLLDWIIDYGRDSRFDPFIGGSTSRRSTDDSAQGVAGPSCNRTGSTAGRCSTGACSAGCKSKYRNDGDGGTTRAETTKTCVD